MERRKPATRQQQRGAATLVVTLVLLVAITLVVLSTAKVALLEQRMSANEQRAVQTRGAAEAGIDFGAAYIGMTGAHLTKIPGSTLGNGSAYSVSFDDTLPDNRVRVTSTGSSDDGLGTRTIIQEIAISPDLPNPPTTPLTTKALTQLSGNIEIINNHGNITVWSGQTVVAGGSALTKISVGGTDNVISSSAQGFGPDVIQTDPNLQAVSDADFFRHYFGKSKAKVEADADLNAVPYPATDANGKLVWIDGNLSISSNTVLGTENAPIILIVDGNLTCTGNPEIHGMVYVTGNWDKGSGNVDIWGGMVVEGELDMGTGSLEIRYDPTTLSNTDQIGDPVGLPGTWRDWS